MDTSGALKLVALDKTVPVPLHFQLQRCIISAIEDGRLKPGQRLPSILAYAKSCDISPATVAQAFTQLARDGFVVSHRGRGTLVAEPKVKTTEVLIHSTFSSQEPGKGSFFYQIVDGLQRKYNDPARRFIFTQCDNPPPSARELLDVCRARGSDGMVVYRPIGELTETVRAVSIKIPTVALFYQVGESMADCVLADPAAPLAEILDAQISRGIHRFIYVGLRRLIEEGPDSSPYNLILKAFQENLSIAGIAPDVRLSDSKDDIEGREECMRMAAELPDDAVIVAAVPEIVDAARRAGCQSQFITYTESATSLDRVKGKADVLYMGLEMLSAKAVELLEARRANPDIPQRCISVRSEIYPSD